MMSAVCTCLIFDIHLVLAHAQFAGPAVVCAMAEGDGFFDAVDWESAIKRKEEELRSCKRELDREIHKLLLTV